MNSYSRCFLDHMQIETRKISLRDGKKEIFPLTGICHN
jgi:hypothetical protein